MSSKINLQTCEYARKSSIFQDNQLIYLTYPVFPANNTSIFIHLNKVKYNKVIFSFQYQHLYRK